MKDASVELIGSIIPHPNADRLDLAAILGFQCVVQKGLYKGGETIVYIRPDAVLPIEKWTEDYRKYSPKRIKAVKLRDQWSEGIIVPFEILPEETQAKLNGIEVGSDVSEIIGVTHYEPPAPNDIQAKGGLPYGIPKTDEERWENYSDNRIPYGEVVDFTLKTDGQSSSYGFELVDDKFFILGRSLELHEIFENNYTAHIARYDLKNKLTQFCKDNNISLCLRGESYGQGIQGFDLNPHSKLPKGWAMFSVYKIKEREYANKGDQFYFKNVAEKLGLPTVEFIEQDVVLTPELIQKYSTGITELNGKPFEGIVVQHSKGSFKIINKYYDSKK
jgi:RNA ligase (TIGR02306 family)